MVSVHAVPLARRNLFQDRRRAVLAVAGIAAALLLVLVLDGIFAGTMQQVTAYLRNIPSDVVVSQRGVRTMHMSSSALPETVVKDVKQVPGVVSADGIRFTTSTLRSPTGGQLSYVIGYDTSTGTGGPWRMASGRAPRAGEVVVDEVGAEQLGARIGGTVEVLGRFFRVSGLSSGGTSITNTTTFMPTGDFAAIRGPAISYVLVRGASNTSGSALARRIEAAVPGSTVQTKSEIVGQESRIVRDMSADILQIMSIIGFLIALAVVALTLFTATLSKLHEYTVVKALGANAGRLVRTVLAQALWSIGLGFVAALVLLFAVAALVAALTPNVRLAVETATVVRVAVAAAVAGGIGTLVPLRRLLRLDPATAFGS